MGRTYQVPRPFDHMTVFENVLVSVHQGAGLTGREAWGRADEVLQRTGLIEQVNLPAGRLALLQRKRLILNTPASRIRSASMGLVEISGLAAGPYVLTSAFKQVECYYYHSTAWRLKQQGKNTQWVKVAEETLHVPFYLDDDTGNVLVDPRGAEMDLHCDLSEQYHRSILFSGPEMPAGINRINR